MLFLTPKMFLQIISFYVAVDVVVNMTDDMTNFKIKINTKIKH